MKSLIEKEFLLDVASHRMQVLLDNGIYRHLKFTSAGPHPWNQWFQIVTWPGYLAYSGDMGCFVFSRLQDMFEFFRTGPGDEKGLYINTGYWAEKLQAVDRCGRDSGAEQFSPEKLTKRVTEAVADWITEYGLTGNQRNELRAAVQEDILDRAEDGEHEAHRALSNFSREIGGHKFEFVDTWEWDLRDYTLRFVWCCYAIAWAIRQYDAQAAPAAGAVRERP